MWLWILSRAFLIIMFLAMCWAMGYIAVTWRDVMYEFDEDEYEDDDMA